MTFRMMIREAVKGGGIEEYHPEVSAKEIDYFVTVTEKFYGACPQFFAVTIIDEDTDEPVLYGARQQGDVWRWSGAYYAPRPKGY